MPDNEKLITLDNLGTFRDNVEEEIDSKIQANPSIKKLRFIKDDETKGIVSLVVEDYGDAEIAFDGDYIEVRSAEVQYINHEDDRTYFIASPKEVKVKTDFNVLYQNSPLFAVLPSDNSIRMELPIEDPHDKGRLWNDNGIVKISLG